MHLLYSGEPVMEKSEKTVLFFLTHIIKLEVKQVT